MFYFFEDSVYVFNNGGILKFLIRKKSSRIKRTQRLNQYYIAFIEVWIQNMDWLYGTWSEANYNRLLIIVSLLIY